MGIFFSDECYCGRIAHHKEGGGLCAGHAVDGLVAVLELLGYKLTGDRVATPTAHGKEVGDTSFAYDLWPHLFYIAFNALGQFLRQWYTSPLIVDALRLFAVFWWHKKDIVLVFDLKMVDASLEECIDAEQGYLHDLGKDPEALQAKFL